MGHLGAKEAIDRLAERLDHLHVRAPLAPALRAILSELYTPAEAEVVAAMPGVPSPLGAVARATGRTGPELGALLEGLCRKGLVIDLWSERLNAYLFSPSPFVVGVFEFTMMRSGPDDDHRRRAALFHEYWQEFMAANFGPERRVALARTLPHEAALPEGSVEVLDYERASDLIGRARRFSVGICSCRHEKHHLGEKRCSVPLESCTALDHGADYLIRNGLAREISREEMLELVERSRALGLVMNADNVRSRGTFICHCCSCCCNLLLGLTRFGCPSTVVTSSFVAAVDPASCDDCGRCVRACPVKAITAGADTASVDGVGVDGVGVDGAGAGEPRPANASRGQLSAARGAGFPRVDADLCLGCGVCVTRCTRHALSLEPRRRRVLHPENTFERVILMALDRGTLEHLIFDGPNRNAPEFLRGFVGGFLRLGVVQQALLGDRLRSVFLRTITRLAGAGGKAAAEL